MNEIKKITIIGSGCVANNFAIEMKQAGFTIVEIVGRRETPVKILATKVQAKANIDDYESINQESDLYIISVKDDAISELKSRIRLGDKLIVHTSGSMPVDVLSEISSNYGVLYPLQTFGRERLLSLKDIPFIVLAGNRSHENALFNFASVLSDKVIIMDDNKRSALHLSAVFVNNFTNYMLHLASEILEKENLDIALLKPLLQETLSKAYDISPAYAQTGPAKRNDRFVIQKHISMLSKDRRKLYRLLTDMIKKDFNR